MTDEVKEEINSIVFLMVRWKNKTIYLEGKESDTVEDIKEQIDSLLSVQKSNQRLFKMDNGKPSLEELIDAKSLVNCGITGTATTAYRPFEICLSPDFGNGFEEAEVCPYSSPPDLPGVFIPDKTEAKEN
ncbi:unnamed protein product [Oikopleura dioica]|uniref:Ubiquitin-like domain-containing protein n=2 Tax=Oikopleura dioica TaxID=34765 RepID=E4XU41_OIKDI|nr:unnamed protein product [Oikopleura dioica]